MSRAGIIMEAATVTHQTTAIQQATASKGQLTGYTMCPNWIYDSLLIEENPSVVKVVLYFNRNTTGRTGTSGQRIEFKQATYGLIASRMNMSVRAVGEAMRTALAKGYLVQRKAGRDLAFEGDFYALNWNWPLRVMSNAAEDVIAEDRTMVQSLNSPALNNATFSGQAGQNLPGDERQNLPACINKAKNTQINQKIELVPASELEKQPYSATNPTINSTGKQEKPVKLSDAARQLALESKTKTRAGRRGSSAVGQLITDLTREFGDKPELVLPNITRALNLWRETGPTEREFLGKVYQARKKTLACPLIFTRRQALPGETASGLPNRMPYFFSVLAELLESGEVNLPAPVLSPVSAAKLKPSLVAEKAAISLKEPQPEAPALTVFESAPVLIRQKVVETLQQRFRNSQLAEKAASLEFSLNPTQKQVIISSTASPWLVASLLSSEVALLRLALTPQIGDGYTLLLR